MINSFVYSQLLSVKYLRFQLFMRKMFLLSVNYVQISPQSSKRQKGSYGSSKRNMGKLQGMAY